MILDIIKNRIREVIMVDSINSSQSDFLATHVPFKKIKIINGLGQNANTLLYSEDAFYEKYFCDEKIYDQHQLIIVEGSSGTGKSHFIRWLNAKLLTNGNNNDVVLLIRRDDNTLKGTIQQLLKIDEIKNIHSKDTYDRLIKANQTISDFKFKNQIFHQFLVEIASDEDGSDLISNVEKKQLYALLSNERFKAKICSANGPIERIFHKIVKVDLSFSDEISQFYKEDFVLDTDFGDLLVSDSADKKAIKMVNRLIPDYNGNSKAKDVSDYLNSMIENVIQSCTGIEPGDFQLIFKEIRKELKKQNKNLILLIEDITSFTGVNQALLSALITGHTGLYESEELCRLVSVVGTTSQYYSTFRDNYTDRITTQVTIEDGAIGSNNNDLFEFFAKYLNAISLEKSAIIDWFEKGANQRMLPIHEDYEHENWDMFKYGDSKINLYPFTKKSILGFYNNMETIKTPRHILREIIQPALFDIIANKKRFLSFARNKRFTIDETIETRLRNIVNNMDIDQVAKNDLSSRAICLVSVYSGSKFTSESIYDVDIQIWKEFGFADLIAKIDIDTNNKDESEKQRFETSQDSEETKVVPIIKNVNKDYEDFQNNLRKWFYGKEVFNRSNDIRDTLKSLVYDTIDWQGNDVPLKAKYLLNESSKDLLGFKRQDRGADKVLILLEDNDETYQLLNTIGKFLYLGNKTWNFEDNMTSVYYFTTWLRKYNKLICNTVLDEIDGDPYYIKTAIIIDLYYKILNNYRFINKGIPSVDDLIKKVKTSSSLAGHGSNWYKLLEYYNQHNEVTSTRSLYIDYFSLTQGTTIGKVKFLNYTHLEKVFESILDNSLEIEELKNREYFINIKRDTVQFYNKIKKDISKIVKEELDIINLAIKQVTNAFSFAIDEIEISDLRNLLRDCVDFYNYAEKYSFNINNNSQNVRKLLDKTDEIVSAIEQIKKIQGENTIFKQMLILSTNPMKMINEFINVIETINSDMGDLEHYLAIEEVKINQHNMNDFDDARFDIELINFKKIIAKE